MQNVSEVFQRNWIECHANDGIQLNKPVSAPVHLSLPYLRCLSSCNVYASCCLNLEPRLRNSAQLNKALLLWCASQLYQGKLCKMRGGVWSCHVSAYLWMLTMQAANDCMIFTF